MQGLRERHKDERRVEILRAARDLVAEGGVDGLTMRLVAERAGVSVPTIYNLIGGRTQVLAALMAAGGDRLGDLLAGSGGDLTARLVGLGEALAAVVGPNEAVVAAVLADGVTAPLGEDSLFARFARRVAEVLADARAEGTLESTADPGLLAERCVALASGAVIVWATGHHDDARLRDDLVHGVLLVLAASVTDRDRSHVQVELDRRTRRLTRARARAARPRPSAVAR